MIRKKYNPDSSATNTLQIAQTDAGCCGDAANQVCKYAGNLATLTNLKSITLVSARDKVGEVTLPLTASSSISQLKSQLLALIESEGFLVDGVDAIRITKKADNTYDIALVGEAEFVSYMDNVTSELFVKTCDPVLICEFKSVIGDGTAVPYEFNGTTTSLGDIAYPTTDAADIQNMLYGPIDVGPITVTADATLEAYVAVIKEYSTAQIKIGGKTAMKCCCVVDYE